MTAPKQRWEAEARLSELEMFKKIEIMDMSKAVAAHISRRIAALDGVIGGEK